MEDFLVLEYMDLFFKKRRFSMSINYTMVAVIMLFVILISIQFTLNKIFMILKEIKEILINKNIKDENNERIRKY
ncbi:hypothetical protein CLOBAR_00340 [Intestinibacter bartlettii DSM 16795]|jgi:uncharacterized protein HemY|nr:hypothetical protein CLOBAR_00340 [Intestinibacter bartlettii DSM 16795]